MNAEDGLAGSQLTMLRLLISLRFLDYRRLLVGSLVLNYSKGSHWPWTLSAANGQSGHASGGGWGMSARFLSESG
jgi:hypothetical protein